MRKSIVAIRGGKAGAPDAKAIEDGVIEGAEAQATYKQKT